MDFWFENKPSGNPVLNRERVRFGFLNELQKPSDILTAADPSFLVLAYPKLFCSYFNLTLASPERYFNLNNFLKVS
jgi:hypothetical protein